MRFPNISRILRYGVGGLAGSGSTSPSSQSSDNTQQVGNKTQRVKFYSKCIIFRSAIGVYWLWITATSAFVCQEVRPSWMPLRQSLVNLEPTSKDPKLTISYLLQVGIKSAQTNLGFSSSWVINLQLLTHRNRPRTTTTGVVKTRSLFLLQRVSASSSTATWVAIS